MRVKLRLFLVRRFARCTFSHHSGWCIVKRWYHQCLRLSKTVESKNVARLCLVNFCSAQMHSSLWRLHCYLVYMVVDCHTSFPDSEKSDWNQQQSSVNANQSCYVVPWMLQSEKDQATLQQMTFQFIHQNFRDSYPPNVLVGKTCESRYRLLAVVAATLAQSASK